MRRSRDVKDAADRAAAEDVATPARAPGHQPSARAGGEGKLFGSVTAADVADAVQAQTGIELDRRKLHLDEPDPRARHPPRAGEAPRRRRVPGHRRGVHRRRSRLARRTIQQFRHRRPPPGAAVRRFRGPRVPGGAELWALPVDSRPLTYPEHRRRGFSVTPPVHTHHMTSQLTLIKAPRPRPVAKLDARTRELGLRGVAEARRSAPQGRFPARGLTHPLRPGGGLWMNCR